MYKEPDIPSPYKKNNLGKSLYEVVMDLKPKKIVEFGVLYGYSTISMAEALKALNQGKIFAYDLWDDFSGEHTTIDVAQKNINDYQVAELVTLGKKDLADWLLEPEPFDLVHIDVLNTGDTIVAAYKGLEEMLKKGSAILFEGGTLERDLVDWMIKGHKTPMNIVKDDIGYEVIDVRFPGLSIIRAS